MSDRFLATGATGQDVYEYALLRVVPRIERGECFNAGVLVYSRSRALVAARTHLDEAKLLVLDPGADVAGVRAALRAVEGVCAGETRPGRPPATTPDGGSGGLSRPVPRSSRRDPCTLGSPRIRRPRPSGCSLCW